MKALFIFILCTTALFARNGAYNLRDVGPDTRNYLVSVENGLLGETAWRSYSATNLSTSDYTGTNTYYTIVDLVDADNQKMRWLTQSVAGFSVSTGGTAGTFEAALSSSTLSFTAGSAVATLTLTGAFSIGSTVTVSFPALSFGAVSSVTGSKVLTFNE